ncbi:hypothetical protein IscW_ISCW005344 [Ixodes scapularis]|uniref:Uncharacterized protein n=1 Tax=Ixodes scapularis TaxID=6945 RepID=B7PQF7_IXOSC|nr:hypothetical protein IscW_ISCW005344 [Ixodes scapularis]|eukprot:XP_002435999.1 hypothetical protein IscW_ISCW005344 [Ixodes scapularis]
MTSHPASRRGISWNSSDLPNKTLFAPQASSLTKFKVSTAPVPPSCGSPRENKKTGTEDACPGCCSLGVGDFSDCIRVQLHMERR